MRILRNVFVLLMSISAAASADRIPADIHEHIAQRVQNGDCVGVVVCVVDAGGSCCLSEGVLSKDSDRKVDEKTVFEIGSMTKAFTGTLLADMVLRGEVALDDPVQKYLPEGAKMPTRASVTRSPARSESCMLAASSGSTPTMRACG